MELVLFVEFDLDGDFEGLEEADEDPKLLEYDLESDGDGDVGFGADDLTGLGEEEIVRDFGDLVSILSLLLFRDFDGLEEDCLDLGVGLLLFLLFSVFFGLIEDCRDFGVGCFSVLSGLDEE